MELKIVCGPKKFNGNKIAACIVTRSGREKYLKRVIDALKKQPIDIFVWANGPINPNAIYGAKWSHIHPFNVGQHVAHNEMLDEVIRRGWYDWHLRIDDDCWIRGKNWLTRLLKMQDSIKGLRGKYAVISLNIAGLNNPPAKEHSYEIANEIVDHVKILGGIFRLSPMPLMRYFRWDERQAMGFGDATQFANFCASSGTDMLRMQDIRASHGKSTAEQNAKDSDWEYEHDMLQFVPLGL